jgi:hypothetical protein
MQGIGKQMKIDNNVIPVLMFLGVIFATLCVIIMGYIHGNMNVGAVWHNIHNFN